ncbi:MAG: hypothetical protein EXS17_05260, partial [Phycisphaerales bacterium]|nr:hypothetical protein [Phycisphaerales bacterium]
MDNHSADANARDGITVKRALAVLSITIAALSSRAFADGGAVVDRGRYGAFDVTVFLTPIPPTAGKVDLSMLLSRGGEPQIDLPVRVRAVGPSGIVEEVQLGAAETGNRLLRSGSLALEMAGTWHFTVQVGSDASDRGSFTLKVAPAPPPWRAFLPWMLLWIPVAILMIAREVLVHRQRVARHAW